MTVQTIEALTPATSEAAGALNAGMVDALVAAAEAVSDCMNCPEIAFAEILMLPQGLQLRMTSEVDEAKRVAQNILLVGWRDIQWAVDVRGMLMEVVHRCRDELLVSIRREGP